VETVENGSYVSTVSIAGIQSLSIGAHSNESSQAIGLRKYRETLSASFNWHGHGPFLRMLRSAK